jgi:hypothetical protein
LLTDFQQRYGHAPSCAEWEDFVVEEAVFASDEAKIRRVAARVLDELAFFEVMSSEISVKARDAEMRRVTSTIANYNFGNF